MAEAVPVGSLRVGTQPEAHERADAAANRRLILQTASRLFGEQGVPAVTMAEIAAEAGVGKGTLYRRFANKAELALALMDQQTRGFQDEVLEQLRQRDADGDAYLEQLAYFLDALVHFTDSHLPLLCEVQSHGLAQQGREQSMPYFWQYQTVRGLLLRALERGELRGAIDIDYTTDALLAPVRADIFRFQRGARGFSLARISGGLQAMAASLAR